MHRHLRNERMYLPRKVADTTFHIQGDGIRQKGYIIIEQLTIF